MWNSQWNETWQGKQKYWDKTFPSVTLSTTNPTWVELSPNPSRRGGKPSTNRLSYGTAMQLRLFQPLLFLSIENSFRLVFYHWPLICLHQLSQCFAQLARTLDVYCLAICSVTWVPITSVALYAQWQLDKLATVQTSWRAISSIFSTWNCGSQICLRSEVQGILWRCNKLMTSYFLSAMDGAFSIYVECHGELSILMVNMVFLENTWYRSLHPFRCDNL
jgi:hypothetical protein